MPIVDRQPVQALAHCGQQLDDSGALSFDDGGRPFGTERCPGYAQQKVPAILETISYTYSDGQGAGGSSDPMDAVVGRLVEKSTERLLFADEADRPCPSCGSPRELSQQVRPQYASLGGARGGPDQLFADRRARRETIEAQQASANAAERSAAALEKLAGGAETAQVAQLQAQVRELSAIVAQLRNGGDQRPSDVAPRPRKRSSA